MHWPSAGAAGGIQTAYAARSYRHSICTLAYVRLDHANGGIIRNLSDGGIGIQAVGRLHPEQVVHLRFEFIRPRAKFELVGQVAWADANGQAGVRFTDVSLRTSRVLKDWMLTDLLTAALELNGAGSLSRSAEDGLVMSSLPFRPIRLHSAHDAMPLDQLTRELRDEAARVHVPWWPVGIRQRTLAGFIDGMTIVSAVLLFSIIVVELTDAFPSWPGLAIVESAVALVFALLYRYLCRLVLHCSLGTRLARIAADGVVDSPAASSL